MNKDCALLLSTYDGGEDLWEGFFKALKTQWPEFDLPIAVNTETKTCKYEGYNITSYNVKNPKMPWGKRLRSVLKRIDTPYVLLFLEDYWLDERVDNKYFLESIEWMKNNQDVASFSYYPTFTENIKDNRFPKMELRPKKCEYKLNAQVSIWRTKELRKYIRNHESPWEWEVYGSIRAGRYKKKFYSLIEKEKLPFSYGDPLKGCLVKRGKWVKEAAIPLFKKYDINIDCSIRGFAEEDKIVELPHETLWQRFKKPHKIKRIVDKTKIMIRYLRSVI